MSRTLLNTILGPVYPNRPKFDNLPTPYRLTVEQSQALNLNGSLPSEPSEANQPITENPVNPPS